MKTDAVKRLKAEMLDFLTTTDDMGFWEPYWEVRSRNVPDSDPDSEGEAVAEAAIRELYDAGFISVYRKPWAEQEADLVELAPDEVTAELEADWWRQIPLDRGDVWISATPAGVKATQAE